MAITLTIAGSNFLPQYKTNSVQIREVIQNKSGVMNMNINVQPGDTAPQEGSEIIYKDGSRFLFAGFISRVSPTEIGKGQLFIYKVEASDYAYIFNSKIARRAYTNKTLAYIVADLMDAYVDSTYGFTVTNVATGPTIESITFDHISIRKCFEKLQKLTGYVWYVDYEKNLYFTTQTATAAPEDITETSANFSEVAIDYDTSQLKNSVIVIGSSEGVESATTISESFVGDGTTRSWELGSKPSTVSSITVNGVTKQFSLDANERDTDVFVYSYTGQSFRQTESQTTLTGSSTIVITYYPRVPIIIQRQDATSVAMFSALDGGDGVYEETKKEPTITTRESAIELALQELDQFSMPLVVGKFVTRTNLLDPGSVFSPGQYVTVNLPTHGISSDSAFLIQEVNITLVEDSATSRIEYQYEVRFGGKLVGVMEFLESLATEETDITNETEILTIESLNEYENVDDDAPTHTILNPPFEYGTGGVAQAVWNKSEWN